MALVYSQEIPPPQGSNIMNYSSQREHHQSIVTTASPVNDCTVGVHHRYQQSLCGNSVSVLPLHYNVYLSIHIIID